MKMDSALRLPMSFLGFLITRFLPAVLLFSLVFFLNGCSKETRINRHLEKGNQYFEAKDYAKAEIEYLNVVRLDNKNVPAIRRLAQMSHQQGRLLQAYVFFSRLKELEPSNADAHAKCGLALAAGGKLDEAISEALIALSKQPTNEEALLLLTDAAIQSHKTTNMDMAAKRLADLRSQAAGQPAYHAALANLAFAKKDTNAAAAAIKQALALNPKSSAALSAAAFFYWSQGDVAQADQAFKAAADNAPPGSLKPLQYVDFKLRTDDFPAAKKALEEIVAKNPDHLPTLQRQAEIALLEKRYDDCATILAKITARDPGSFDAAMLGARLKLAKGEASKAVADLDRLAQARPRVPQIHHQLALAHLFNKDADKAILSLKKAVDLDPAYPEAVLLLSELNIKKGDSTTAINDLSILLRKFPRMPQAQLLLAEAYRARKDLEQAADVYRRMAAAYPTNAQVPLLLGAVYLQQSKTNEARQNFEKALRVAPTSFDALRSLVALDMGAAQYQNAEQRVQATIQKYPNSPLLYLLLADIYGTQFVKQTNNTALFNQAEAALLKSVGVATNFADGHMALARLYVSANRHQEALDKLNSMVAKNPKDMNSLLMIALIHSEKKDYAGARDAYEKMLAINPKSTLVLNNLAYLYSEHLGQLEKGYKAAQQAYDLNPKDAFVADTLGWILYKRGDYAGALKYLQQSAQAMESQAQGEASLQKAEIFYHLGMAYYMAGQPEPARQNLARALQFSEDKEFSGKPEARQRLNQLASSGSSSGTANLADLERRFQAQPNDAILLSQLAVAYLQNGQADKAKPLFETALQQNPKNITALKNLAILYASSPQDREKAFDLAKKARALASDDPEIAHLLGRLAYQSGDHKWALSLLQESVRKLSTQPDVQYDLAWAQFSNGRLHEAETAMRIAAESKIPFSRTEQARQFLTLVLLYANPAKIQQSSASVQQALKMDPNDAPALLVQAVQQEQQNQLKPAQQTFENILVHHPFFVVANKHLAGLFLRQGDTAKAYEHAVKAREAFPADPEVAKTLGILAFKRSEYPRALQLFKEASQKLPSDRELLDFLAKTQAQLQPKKT